MADVIVYFNVMDRMVVDADWVEIFDKRRINSRAV